MPFIIYSFRIRVQIGNIEVLALVDYSAKANIIKTNIAKEASLGITLNS